MLTLNIVIAWVATSLGLLTFIPQSILLFKTKDTASISLYMYVLSVMASTAWISWSAGYFAELIFLNRTDPTFDMNIKQIILSSIPGLILNLISLLTAIYILINKIYNMHSAKLKKISEREFCEVRKCKKQHSRVFKKELVK